MVPSHGRSSTSVPRLPPCRSAVSFVVDCEALVGSGQSARVRTADDRLNPRIADRSPIDVRKPETGNGAPWPKDARPAALFETWLATRRARAPLRGSAPKHLLTYIARATAERHTACRKQRRLDTPTRYIMRASEPRFRSSEALSGTWWQVKDSNLRSFRDGFTVHWLQGCDQRKRLARNNFRTFSQKQPSPTGANRTLPGACRSPWWSRSRAGSAG